VGDAARLEVGAGTERVSRLGELAWLFLRLGTTAFGGPAAHIAMMDDEVVRRRRWLSREEFLDLLGATNLIPGPNSTEMAIHIGHRRAGWRGLLVAGLCFILPAGFITFGVAWVYVRFGALPRAEGILYGIKPVMIAVVLQALWVLGRTALKTQFLAGVAAASLAASLAGVNELLLLLLAGMISFVWSRRGANHGRAWPALLGMPMIGPVVAAAPTVGATPFGLWPLFLLFLKVGSVLFGSGYVLLAFLRADLVERYRWMTDSQLLDAIAVGQMTPGPVFTTATFVGYVLGGPWAALVATGGIFAPAFIFVALSGPLVLRLRKSRVAAAVLDGVNAGSLALMGAVALQLAPAAVVDLPTTIIALISGVLLFRVRMNPAWLVAGGAMAGGVLSRGLQ
jgi:chromate transporter